VGRAKQVITHMCVMHACIIHADTANTVLQYLNLVRSDSVLYTSRETLDLQSQTHRSGAGTSQTFHASCTAQTS